MTINGTVKSIITKAKSTAPELVISAKGIMLISGNVTAATISSDKDMTINGTVKADEISSDGNMNLSDDITAKKISSGNDMTINGTVKSIITKAKSTAPELVISAKGIMLISGNVTAATISGNKDMTLTGTFIADTVSGSDKLTKLTLDGTLVLSKTLNKVKELVLNDSEITLKKDSQVKEITESVDFGNCRIVMLEGAKNFDFMKIDFSKSGKLVGTATIAVDLSSKAKAIAVFKKSNNPDVVITPHFVLENGDEYRSLSYNKDNGILYYKVYSLTAYKGDENGTLIGDFTSVSELNSYIKKQIKNKIPGFLGINITIVLHDDLNENPFDIDQQTCNKYVIKGNNHTIRSNKQTITLLQETELHDLTIQYNDGTKKLTINKKTRTLTKDNVTLNNVIEK